MTRKWSDIIASSNGDYGIYCAAPGTPVTLSHRPDLVVEAASTIKLPILIALLDADKLGRVSLRKRFNLKRSQVGRNGSGILQSMHFNAPFTLYNLAFLMMSVSDNVATNAIIDILGFDALNNYFKDDLGLKHTRLIMRKLDFEPKYSLNASQKMAETTSREMALVVERLLAGHLLDPGHTRTALRIMGEIQKTNFGRRLPPAKIKRYGSKTGYIDDTVEKQEILNECGFIETKRGQCYVFAVFARLHQDSDLRYNFDSSTRLEISELGRAIFEALEAQTNAKS